MTVLCQVALLGLLAWGTVVLGNFIYQDDQFHVQGYDIRHAAIMSTIGFDIQLFILSLLFCGFFYKPYSLKRLGLVIFCAGLPLNMPILGIGSFQFNVLLSQLDSPAGMACFILFIVSLTFIGIPFVPIVIYYSFYLTKSVIIPRLKSMVKVTDSVVELKPSVGNVMQQTQWRVQLV